MDNVDKKKKSELTFEHAMARLEEIAESLEEGSQPLEKTMALFEEVRELTALCQEKLNQAEKKLQTLTKTESNFDLE